MKEEFWRTIRASLVNNCKTEFQILKKFAKIRDRYAITLITEYGKLLLQNQILIFTRCIYICILTQRYLIIMSYNFYRPLIHAQLWAIYISLTIYSHSNLISPQIALLTNRICTTLCIIHRPYKGVLHK